MQVTLNGTNYELVPFNLVNDIEKSAQVSAGIGGNGGFTDWESTGTVLDLRFIYGDVYADHGGTDYTGDWEDMFIWSGAQGGDPVEYTAQARVISSASDPQKLTWQFRRDKDQTNPRDWTAYQINYDGTGYDWVNQLILYTQTNANAERCVNANDVPIYQPGYLYNGLHEVGLCLNSYSQNDISQSDGEWYDTRTDQHNIYQEWPMPPNAHNLVTPFDGPHYLHTSGNMVWQLFYDSIENPRWTDLQFSSTSVEDISKPKTPEDDNTPPGGGKGPYTDTSHRIGPAALPRTSALSAGFVKAYMPSAAQMQALSTYMLTDNFIEGVKKLMANPIDYIMGLHMIPVTPTTTNSTIKVGGLDTEISSALVTNEYVQYDCGTLAINEYWGSFIDYAPSTKAELYLPFIGTVPLDIDDIMGTPCTLHLYYNINVLSGACTAFLDCQTGRKLNSVCYYWNGSMSSQIPVSGNDYSNKVNAALSAVGNLIGVAATGSVGNAVGLVQNVAQATLQKPSIQKSGTMGGDPGMLSEFQPFVILTRPVQALPKNFNKLRGNTSMIGGKVSSFSGYLEVSEIDLSGIACTEAEKDLILQAFKEGCFV